MGFDDLAERMARSQRKKLGPVTESIVHDERGQQKARANIQVAFGLVLLGVGLLITITTYSTASEGGGTYFIMYGPIISGIIMLCRGLMNGPDRTPEQIAAASRRD